MDSKKLTQAQFAEKRVFQQTPDQPYSTAVVLVDPATGSPYAAGSGGTGGGDASAANQTTQIAQVSGVMTPDTTRIRVEPLGQPGVARQLAVTATSANVALTSTVRRVSLYARLADLRYSVGSSAQTASTTSHYLSAGERIDISLPATPNIAAIRAGATDAALEISELL